MKKDGLSFITRFKFNSVFIRIFFILDILCIIMMLVFYYFIMDVVKTNFEEKTYSANANVLEQTSNSANIIIDNVGRIMHNTIFNTNVMTSILAPNMMNYNKDLSLTQQLSDTVENYNLLNYAFLYVTDSHQIYTSNNVISDFSDSIDRNLLNKYIDNPYINMYKTEKNIFTDVRIINNRICLFQEFPYTTYSRKGTLMFELSKFELSKIIYSNINKLNQNVYIFDSEYNPVFLYNADYNALGNIDNFKDKMINETGFFPVKESDGHEYTYFYYKSKQIGWIYVYRVLANDLKVPFGLILSIALPFFIVFIIISLIFSFYITLRIYKPINKLMVSVSHSSEYKINHTKNPKLRDEFDFLGAAYEDTAFKMGEIMYNMTPIILENTFTNLLNGREISEESVRKTLSSTISSFNADDIYSVILISIAELLKKESPDLENDFYVISVINIIHSLKNDSKNNISLRIGDTSIAVVIGFLKDETQTNIKQVTMNFCNDIINKTQSLPYTVNTSVGGAYEGIFNVKKSYDEAQENLNFQLYFGNEKKYKDSIDYLIGDNQKNEIMNNKTYIVDQTKRVIQEILNGDIETAKRTFKLSLDVVFKDVDDIKSIRYIYKSMIDIYIEKMLSIKIDIDEIEFIRKSNMDKDLDNLDTIKEVKEYAERFCNRSIDLIDSYSRRTQYRHIECAKDYVENNYQNINLSLNMVAEYVGINSSYLSRLFKEILNIKFVDFLNKYRVERAKYLIDNTDFAITEIGYKTGFNSMPTFFRVFKKYNGITPGQYRNNNN